MSIMLEDAKKFYTNLISEIRTDGGQWRRYTEPKNNNQKHRALKQKKKMSDDKISYRK